MHQPRAPAVPYSSADRSAIFFIADLLVRVIEARGFRGYEVMKRELVDPAVSNWEIARGYDLSAFQVRLLRQRVDLVVHLEHTELSPVRSVQEKIRRATETRRSATERRRA